jgi:hypothetical protein
MFCNYDSALRRAVTFQGLPLVCYFGLLQSVVFLTIKILFFRVERIETHHLWILENIYTEFSFENNGNTLSYFLKVVSCENGSQSVNGNNSVLPASICSIPEGLHFALLLLLGISL